jgi:hypothetical protein
VIGEGTKPIFDREELKKSDENSDEIEEHRTIKLTRKLSTGKTQFNICYQFSYSASL